VNGDQSSKAFFVAWTRINRTCWRASRQRKAFRCARRWKVDCISRTRIRDSPPRTRGAVGCNAEFLESFRKQDAHEKRL